MYKVVCKECKKTTDDTNKKCPNCGYKNKLDVELYLKKQTNNNICPKCGNKLSKKDVFCTKCGYKKDNFITKIKNVIELLQVVIARNKRIFFLSIGAIFLIIFSIVYSFNFNRDMAEADRLYDAKEFSDAEKLIDKYPIHFNNDIYDKINATKHYTRYYETADYYEEKEDYKRVVDSLLKGYEQCLRASINEDGDIEKKALNELKDLYRQTLYIRYDISNDDVQELINLEDAELDSRLDDIAEQIEKNNTCDKSQIDVVSYGKYRNHINVTLKNNNGCTWNIKSYSEIRVYFTDGSYEDAYLGVNINLESDERYTFEDCYLGSNNEDKTVRSVTFID